MRWFLTSSLLLLTFLAAWPALLHRRILRLVAAVFVRKARHVADSATGQSSGWNTSEVLLCRHSDFSEKIIGRDDGVHYCGVFISDNAICCHKDCLNGLFGLRDKAE